MNIRWELEAIINLREEMRNTRKNESNSKKYFDGMLKRIELLKYFSKIAPQYNEKNIMDKNIRKLVYGYHRIYYQININEICIHQIVNCYKNPEKSRFK